MKKFVIIISVILMLMILPSVIIRFILNKDEEIEKAAILNLRKYYYVVQNDTNIYEGLLIEDIKFKDSLVKFYNDFFTDTTGLISANFEARPIPLDTAVNIVEYATKDSSLVKIIFHYKTDNSEQYDMVGYVLSKFLHDKKSTEIEK
jgi:hypothetical protein